MSHQANIATETTLGHVKAKTNEDGTLILPKTNLTEVNRLLANHEAWFDIDGRSTPNSGKFYDLLDGTNDLSLGKIDMTKTTAVGALAIGATTITVSDVTGFKTGQEVTIYDDVNLERVIISAIDAVNKVLTVSILTKAYKDKAGVARSMVVVDTINKLMKFDDWVLDQNNFRMYELGTEHVVWQVGYSQSATASSQSKNADHLYLYAKYNVSGLPAITYEGKMDMTNITTIEIDLENTGSTSIINLTRISISNTAGNDPYYGEVTAHHSNSFARKIVSMDVSSLTGDYYVRVSAATSDSNTTIYSEVKVYKVYGKDSNGNTVDIIPLLVNDVRYNITLPTTTDEVVAWVNRQIGDLTVDGAVSVVDTTANESYTAMLKTTATIDSDTEEDQFVGSVATAEEKVTLKLNLKRTATTADKAIEKIIGAVS